jgi:hypothetical protein
MRFIAFVVAALALASPAHAEWKKVAKADSRILLVTPFAEATREVFEVGDWSSNSRTVSSYAAVVPAKGPYPRVQVYLEQTAPLVYWRSGSALDGAWIKSRFPFFKDKEVQITAPAPNSDAFLRRSHFTVGIAQCVAFEMRHITNDPGSAATPEARDSVSGFFCPSPGTPVSEDLLRKVTEGIFIRRDGRVERVLQGVNAPIPPQVSQTTSKSG